MKKIFFAFLYPLFLIAVPFPNPSRAPFHPFVSGDGFRACADYVYDEEDTSLDPRDIQASGIIFVKGDYLSRFVREIHPYITNKYILITHNSDETAPGPFHALLDEENLIAWFTQNMDGSHPKLHPIPIGIANRYVAHGNGEILKHVQSLNLPKTHLLYLNIVVSTFPSERKGVYSSLGKKSFAYAPGRKGFEDYLKDIASSKFTAAPRGNGLDTHRLWEALYLGSYPVVKSSSLDPLYADLPVVIVDNWSKVSEKFLRKNHKKLKKKAHNWDKLSMQYWVDLIHSYKVP